jgi:hypothetical protein
LNLVSDNSGLERKNNYLSLSDLVHSIDSTHIKAELDCSHRMVRQRVERFLGVLDKPSITLSEQTEIDKLPISARLEGR